MVILLACHDGTALDSPSDTGGSDTVETAHPTDTDSGDSGDSGTDTATETDTEVEPVDDDRDGYGVDLDCDDANPYVHPDATEFCDGVDQDCDGDAVAPGACAMDAELRAGLTSLYELYSGTQPVILSGVGEGSGSCLAMCFNMCEGADGSSAPTSVLYRSQPESTIPAEFPLGGWFSFDDLEYSSTITQPIDAGDVTGDGVPDLAILDESGAVGYVVFPGPLAEGAHLTYADALVWSVPYLPTVGQTAARNGGDLDGDGANDLALYSADMITNWGEVVAVFGHARTTSEFVELTYPYAYQVGGMLIDQDLDGDGVNDLLVDGYETGWVSGVELRGLPGASMSDALSTILQRSDDANQANRSGQPSVASLGDIDGDGHLDLALGFGGAVNEGAVETLYGEVFVVRPGGASGTVNVDEVSTSILGFGAASKVAFGWHVYSVAENGVSGAIVIGDGYSEAWMVPPELPALHTEFEDIRFVHLVGEPAEAPAPTTIRDVGGDVTGDGIGDFGVSSSELMTHGIIPGFIPPWDEAEYW